MDSWAMLGDTRGWWWWGGGVAGVGQPGPKALMWGMDGRGGAFRGHAEVKRYWRLLKKPP